MTEGAGRLFLNLRPKGATTTLGPKGRRPLSEAMHNLSTQPAALAAPLFIICGEAATTTLGAKGPVKLKNPPVHRAGQS